MSNYNYQVVKDGKKYKLYPLKEGKRLEGRCWASARMCKSSGGKTTPLHYCSGIKQ